MHQEIVIQFECDENNPAGNDLKLAIDILAPHMVDNVSVRWYRYPDE